MVEETGAPHNMYKRVRLRAHLSAYQRKIRRGRLTLGRPTPAFGRTWSASCSGAFCGGVAAKSPDHLPYMHLAGTHIQEYK